MDSENSLSLLLTVLPTLRDFHAPSSDVYSFLKHVARAEIEKRFSSEQCEPRDFGMFGPLEFPYFQMGAISSLELFGLDELIIFSFYWVNRARYRKVADIGANIGLHSIILDRCGFEVRSFEPDPLHFTQLKANLARNHCARVTPLMAAVSTTAGESKFVRVLGNTTGSHLAGAKPDPYGALECLTVKTEDIATVMGWADLIKMDVEGHEAAILEATTREQWTRTDAMVEIGSAANATAVFEHLGDLGVNLFAQKTNWRQVENVEDMPTSYKEGSLFISSKDRVLW